MRKILIFLAMFFAGLVIAVSSTSCSKQKEPAGEQMTAASEEPGSTATTAADQKGNAAMQAASVKKTAKAKAMTKEEREVRETILRHASIMQMQDLIARDRARRGIYADEYLYTGPDGRVFTGDQLIARQRHNRVKIKLIEIENLRVNTFGQTAVANYYAMVLGSEKGFPYSSLRTRVTSVLVKRDGRWQIVNDHLTLTST